MTGDISYKGSNSTCKMIRFIDNAEDTYGNGIGIGGGGLVVVGSGESINSYIGTNNPNGGDEKIILCSDESIEIYTNCQNGVGSAKHCSIDVNGAANFNKVYNAVYNDYAEFFPRGEETEPGDIVALDLSSDDERYIKATSNSKIIAGIHSNEYAMIIGGESAEQGEDYIQKNIEKYIPVSLCGRVHCKCIGVIHKGDIIVVSDIPGIGRAKSPNENIEFTQIVGYAVDEDLDTSIRQVRIRVRG